jgi:hypothetical protein
MTTPEARAREALQAYESACPRFWPEDEERLIFVHLVAEQIRLAQAEVWAEVKQQCEIVLDIAKVKETP